MPRPRKVSLQAKTVMAIAGTDEGRVEGFGCAAIESVGEGFVER